MVCEVKLFWWIRVVQMPVPRSYGVRSLPCADIRKGGNVNYLLPGIWWYGSGPHQLLFVLGFIRNRQFLSSFSPAGGKNPAAIGRCHSFPETMLVPSLPLRRLKCSLTHILVFWDCKDSNYSEADKYFRFFFRKLPLLITKRKSADYETRWLNVLRLAVLPVHFSGSRSGKSRIFQLKRCSLFRRVNVGNGW